MKFKVGEKIRVLLWKEEDGEIKEEITTTVLKVNPGHPTMIRVAWSRAKSGGWWIYIDPNKSARDCKGWGKVICKNWKKYEKSAE